MIYYNNLEFNLSGQNPDCWNLFPLTLFLQLAFIGFVYGAILSGGELGYIVTSVVLGLVFIVEAENSKTINFIRNLSNG